MTGQEITTRVKDLNLPKGSYVVFGSCPLTIAGLREAEDIDLYVTEKVLADLRRSGWRGLRKSSKDIPLTHDVFEAHANWDFSPYNPTLKKLLKTATIKDGVPFASLREVRKWKAASGRPKDKADIRLIDEYSHT